MTYNREEEAKWFQLTTLATKLLATRLRRNRGDDIVQATAHTWIGCRRQEGCTLQQAEERLKKEMEA